MKKEVSIIVPVYNEADNLKLLANRIEEARKILGKESEVIFIDDGSKDESFGVLKEIQRGFRDIRVIRLKKNFGQTAALSAGFDNAAGDILVTIDADMQNDPMDIPLLVKNLEEGYDVVSGWRKNRKDNFFTRKLPSYAANMIISRYTGVKLHDYGCTLKAYKKDILNDINLYGELHRFIPALLSWSGAKIMEVPVNHNARKYGKSKYNIFRAVNVILDLLTVKFLLTSFKGPMQIFGRLGLWTLILGFLCSLEVVIMKIAGGIDMTGNPVLYLTIFLFFAALQFISLGFLGEMDMRIYREGRRKKIYVIAEVLDGK